MRSRARRRTLVGALLRSLRLEANLKQAEVAERLGRPQSYVSKYESGEQSLDVVEAAEIVAAMGVTFRRFAERLNGELRSE